MFNILINYSKILQSDINFTSKINDLQPENSSIMIELDSLRKNLFAAQTHIDQLQQQNVKLSLKVRQLKRRMCYYNRGLKKIILISQRLDSPLRINSDEEEEKSDIKIKS